MLLENHPLTEVSLIMFVLVQLKCNGQQTWHFGTFRGRVYLGWNYNTLTHIGYQELNVILWRLFAQFF